MVLKSVIDNVLNKWIIWNKSMLFKISINNKKF